MNQLVVDALKRVQKTEWMLDRGVLEIRNCVPLFPNFSGQPNRFGNAAKVFNIVLSRELKEFLEECQLNDKSLHVHIHQYPQDAAGTDDDPCLYYINVKVRMDGEYPPIVTLFTNKQVMKSDGTTEVRKGRVNLTDATIGCLDRMDIDRADCKLNLRESRVSPGYAVFYLRQLNVIQTIVPDFGGAYED